MVLKLYKIDVSPPARACMMLCQLLDVPVEMVNINIMNQEHKTPEFLELNPVHTVPVLQHDDLILHDSHSILMYLADVYGKDDCLFPKDTKRRALVSQKLFFHNSILFPNFRNIIYSVVKDGEKRLTEAQKTSLQEAYSFLEEFLRRTKFLAGDQMTIADLAAITTVTTLEYIFPIDSERYPKIHGWLYEMKALPVCEKINAPNARVGGMWIKNMLTY